MFLYTLNKAIFNLSKYIIWMCIGEKDMIDMDFLEFVNDKHYLNEILFAQDKSDLQMLAEVLDIKGYKKLNDEGLRDALYDALTDVHRFADYLKYFPYETRRVFASEKSNVAFNFAKDPYEQFAFRLYLSPVTDEENWFLLIPEEIKETYREAIEQGLLADEDNIYSLLRICLAGATHIYGMCTMDHFCKLVKELTGLDVDADFVIDYCDELKAYPNLSDFIATYEYVCDLNLFKQGYTEFLEIQDKTENYYMPTLDELTHITNFNYMPFNINANALKDFLLRKGYVEEEFLATIAVATLQSLLTTGADPADILPEVFSNFMEEETFNRLIESDGFLNKYDALVNSTHIAIFKGHTPNDIFSDMDNAMDFIEEADLDNVIEFPSKKN